MKVRTSIYRSLRAGCLLVVCAAALGVCATAGATVGPQAPSIICAYCGDSSVGWTGCTSQSEEHSASVPLIASVKHYLVVSYCKRGGIITSISVAAHGCDVGGLVSCGLGPAWQTSGGVGTGFATFEAHATWVVNLPPFYSNYDTLNLTIPVG